MITQAQQDFINKLVPLAQIAENTTGVPASVTIAQAIVETGWGHHTILDANNYFGIKGVGPAGSVTVPTREVIHGEPVIVDAAFRKYNSLEESVTDHANFFVVNPRYAHALELGKAGNANGFVMEIAKAGYATDPHYPVLLASIMQLFNLQQYDKAPPAPAKQNLLAGIHQATITFSS